MRWEQRLRDIVLAGGAGALAAVGCVDGSGARGDSGSEVDVASCCNVSSDPCCPSLYCGETATVQCTEKMACESDGGTWDYLMQLCAHPEDAGPSDAPADAIVDFCCNANADPCCPSLHCGETATARCTEKMACESDGGTWDYLVQRCAGDAGPSDASSDATEAGSSDTGVDGHGQPD